MSHAVEIYLRAHTRARIHGSQIFAWMKRVQIKKPANQESNVVLHPTLVWDTSCSIYKRLHDRIVPSPLQICPVSAEEEYLYFILVVFNSSEPSFTVKIRIKITCILGKGFITAAIWFYWPYMSLWKKSFEFTTWKWIYIGSEPAFCPTLEVRLYEHCPLRTNTLQSFQGGVTRLRHQGFIWV